MTEITRVPLQPIAKGSLTKLWIGIIIAILIGAGAAWAAMPRGLTVDTIAAGEGRTAQMGDVVFAKYVGTLPDGTEFDRSQPSPFPPGLFPDGTPFPLEEGSVIQGFLDGLLKTKKGGKYRIEIPADLAYGASPPPGSPIPANSDLVFEVEIMEILTRQEAEQRLQALQQMMSQQQPQGEPGAQQPAQ